MSNMYKNTETINYLLGECPFQCSYCYRNNLKKQYPVLNKRYSGEIRIDEKAISKKMPTFKGDVFVCSMIDLFANKVPDEMIRKILEKLKENQNNTYILQTKNPARLLDWIDKIKLLKNVILGTTIETNRDYNEMSKAPVPFNRACSMERVKEESYTTKQFISIEPILDFNAKLFTEWIKEIAPVYVSIGADSKKNNLPEPEPQKIKQLIAELKQFTEVRTKPNLNRLINK